MHRIDTSTAQADKFGAGKNGFTGGNPQTGQLPTALDQDFFDAVQEEISRVIEAADITLDKGEYGQLLTALTQLFASADNLANKQDKSENLAALAGLTGAADRLPYFTAAQTMALATLTPAGRSLISQANANNMLTYLGALKTTNYLSEIATAGTAAQAAALTNLGLADGSLIPIGVPVPYFAATAPAGWILCNGSAFSASAYPKLAQAYPSLVLPDLRGNVIRGWDNGRGIDADRVLLSEQGDAIRNITGWIVAYSGAGGEGGAFSNGAVVTSLGAGQNGMYRKNFDASTVVPTAAENRVRNIAFNYIVRAA